MLLPVINNTGYAARTIAHNGLRLNHARLSSHQARDSYVRRNSGTYRILALRVEFVHDTLSTTTGDGGFDYEFKDTVYFDPPPHDALYFADHLEFNRFYWQEMSGGNLDFNWDVYPVGDRASYQLPKKMWQYNYNYPVDKNPAHLDSTLAWLFHDAITAADADTSIKWTDYDLVVIFHAGAGAEFDLGFTETPHDIPSAWMVKEDFNLIGLDNGIPVNDFGVDSCITEGLILPETESHDDVQISMAGVVVFLFGHWLGLPALYDRDDGRAVVGKWSLMDRGFGNFYGAIPGPVDAWSRSYMDWLEPTELLPDDSLVSINSLGFQTVNAIDAGRIRISDREYFILECRFRDPDDDSVAVAYDRDGRRMVFNNDYSVDTEPGFRVPVRVDDIDFDTPGSGILIWHVDEALGPLIEEGRFNSVNNRRGLDLEEADGAQDIGRDYPFLTPGYGTDYGIFEDAWFKNNNAHQRANDGGAVAFGDDTYPSSRSNSDAFSHIAISNFSFVDSVMSFKFQCSSWLYDLPVQHKLGNKLLAVGNFDNVPDDQEFILFGNDHLKIFDGSGEILDSVLYGEEYKISLSYDPIVRNLDNDEFSEVVWTAADNEDAVYLLLLDPDPGSGFQLEVIDAFIPTRSPMWTRTKIAFGGPEDQTVLLAVQPIGRVDNENISLVKSYNSSFDLVREDTLTGSRISLHRFGSALSDTFLIIADDYKIYLWNQHGLDLVGAIFPEDDAMRSVFPGPFLVDFDRNGQQDVVFIYEQWGPAGGPEGGQTMEKHAMLLVKDIGYNNEIAIQEYPLDSRFSNTGKMLPVDVDQDGGYELVGFSGWGLFRDYASLLALENNASIVEGFPWHIDREMGCESISNFIIPDLNGDGKLEYQYLSSLTRISQLDDEGRFISRTLHTYNSAIEIKDHEGENLTGFPVALRLYNPLCRLCQLDDDPWLELLMVTDQEFDVYDFEFFGNGTPSVWWGQKYRDDDHSNAIWEPAEPFTPENVSVLLPDDLCYNWPNPASDETYIRYFLNYDATVDVNIFDILGEKVKSFHRQNQLAGFDHEITWSLSNIARGVYVAVVKAEGNGKSETKLVKIAVVK